MRKPTEALAEGASQPSCVQGAQPADGALRQRLHQLCDAVKNGELIANDMRKESWWDNFVAETERALAAQTPCKENHAESTGYFINKRECCIECGVPLRAAQTGASGEDG